MNKYFLVAAFGLQAAAACAQSSVTLFGNIDASIAHYKLNGVSRTVAGSSGSSPSLLGFRGTEDLGGGFTAGFWLEAALLNDTGAGTAAGSLAFQRRSTVGVSTPYGEVRFGRENAPTFWNHLVFDPFNGVGPGSATNIAIGAGGNGGASGNPATLVYVDNSINYRWGYAPNGSSYIGRGFYAQVMHGLAENAGAAPPVGRYTGARGGYSQDKLNAAIAYAVSRGPGAYGGAVGNAFKEFNLGASYDFGFAKLMAHGGFNEAEAANSRYTHWGVGATIPAGPGYIPVSYHRARRDNAVASGARQFALGYVYPLSRRTAIYASIARLENKGGDTFTFRGGNGGTSGLLGGGSGTGYDLGVKHSF